MNDDTMVEAGKPDPTDPEVSLGEDIQRQVFDALKLLEHAVESGFKREDGSTLAQPVIVTIKTTAAMLGISSREHIPRKEVPAIRASQWVEFELAYHRLATVMSPITAQTLKNTEAVGAWREMSPAQSFTRWLWVVAICYAGFVVLGEWGMQHYGPVLDGEAGPYNTWMQIMQILGPYAYGGLGACVYLLRSAHQYIYERTFDLRRKPEYLNRVLLGTIGGGAIILFIEHVTTDDGETIRLSSAALGFLAGYSTDFLFSTIERIIAAILPKVGLNSVRRATESKPPLTVDTAGAGLKELLDRYDAAKTNEDKAFYKALVEKLRDRL